ncbi:GbsR/MarR family transcriptional regulator [Pontibacter silvestris]|uniref:GbsR/MarR family transcriptional regulator n=1 Tax=Pontibacter silvestris TaxID=2305183 RepID=A0ABW4X333_9BACT|nr:MarR family transcriptional regulator [Pontibacter silvestris]MCC9135048.1 MarR family transcriptional regulator [Pontibacter silvestris]
MTLTDKQKALIEKIGIFHEQSGMQPAAARVMGLLFVADKPALAFDEITDALGISKSATSNSINLLIQTDQIDYTTFPGDRKRYFRLKISNWRDGFSKRIEQMTSFKELLREVLEEKKSENTTSNCSDLEEVIGFLDYLHQELPKLLDRWEKSRA